MSQLEKTRKEINLLRDAEAGAGSLIAHQCELTAMLIDKLDELTVVGMTRKRKAKGSKSITIEAYLDECKKGGVDAISVKDTVFKYADDAGIPRTFIELCFKEFVERNKEGVPANKQKSWPQTFRNCVRGNWYKLWYCDAGEYKLTSQGQQASLKHSKKDK